MLKGINIGGKNRLNYLNFLEKKQDGNAELLERTFLFNNEDDKNDNLSNNNSIDKNNIKLNDNNDNNYELINNNQNNDLNEKEIILKVKDEKDNIKERLGFNKNLHKIYEEENDNIEKEITGLKIAGCLAHCRRGQ